MSAGPMTMVEGAEPAETLQVLESPPRRLVVFVTPEGVKSGTWEPVIELLKDAGGSTGCEWLLYETRARGSITEASVDLKARVDQQFILSGAYETVVMVGVSIGAVVARQAYLLSLGLYPDCPVTVRWAGCVERIVLIAAPNRGIGLDLVPALLRGSFRTVLALVPRTRHLVELLTGSDFLTDLKIRWIQHFRGTKPARPLVVHIVPARSGFVPRASMIDEVQFPGAQYIDAPGVNGEQLQDAQRYVGDRALFGLLRKATFGSLLPGPLPPSTGIDRVVFVLHGIRASNTGWVSQVSALVKSAHPRTVVVVASYGYYSMLRFPFALARRRNVRWFQDLYSYNFGRYPGATFYFIGHSYGTYILGQSMARVPAMGFDRIVLVGSVLPREYSWNKLIDSGQVGEIRNDRSSADIPVKVLCSALHALGSDVGTSGVDGFDDGRCVEVFYHKGSHSRPLDQENLEGLTSYLLKGQYSPPGGLVDDLSPTLGVVARLAPAIGVVVVVALLCLIPGLWWVHQAFGLPAALGAASLVVAVAVILDAI